MVVEQDPPHRIIDAPHSYQLRALRYDTGADGGEPYLDLELGKGPEIRRLRFWSPRDLEIEKGFPQSTGGMEILDVSARHLDGIGVRVADCESSWGAITFWARCVVDLADEPAV